MNSKKIAFNYFKYLLKTALKPSIFIFIVGMLVYPLVVTLSDIGEEYTSSQIGLSVAFIAVLAYIVPIARTSYLKKKTKIDYYYSLPIKRRTLANLNLLVGALEIIIPFTLTYFLGMLITYIKYSGYYYGYYFLLYFSLIGLTIPLYIFNTFIASRANSVVDSVFFVLFYTFILWPISVILADVFAINIAYYDTQLITFVPYIDLGNYFNRLIEFGDPVEYELRLPYWLIIVEALTYIPLFILTKKDKSERSEQISNSFFGYRVMLPLYIITLISLIVFENGLIDSIICLFVIAAGLVGYVIYYRKFKLPKRGWLVFTISIVLGVGLGLLFPIIAKKFGIVFIDSYIQMISFNYLPL